MKYISNNFANPVLYEISIIDEIFNNSPSLSAILVASPESEAGTECPYQISQCTKFKFLLPPDGRMLKHFHEVMDLSTEHLFMWEINVRGSYSGIIFDLGWAEVWWDMYVWYMRYGEVM